MHIIIEFRIPESSAQQHFPSNVGVRLGDSVRKVMLPAEDPLIAEIGKIDRQYRVKGRAFFTYWSISRNYAPVELHDVDLFHIRPKKVFEPAGEECGTQYDESMACPECGAGAAQISDLRLDLRKAPRAVDFAETIAGEQIVSQRMAECLIDAGLQGFSLRRVRHKARYEDDPIDLHKVPTGREILRKAEVAGSPHPTWSFWVWLNRAENRDMLDKAVAEYVVQKRQQSRRHRQVLPVWYQLMVTSSPVELSPPTRVGEDPFDENSYGKCPRGDVAGLNLLSEVTVKKESLADADIMATRQMVGVRRGLLRPRPLLLLSPNAWRTVKEAGMRGLVIEVAHLL